MREGNAFHPPSDWVGATSAKEEVVGADSAKQDVVVARLAECADRVLHQSDAIRNPRRSKLQYILRMYLIPKWAVANCGEHPFGNEAGLPPEGK